MELFCAPFESPIGTFWLLGNQKGLVALKLSEDLEMERFPGGRPRLNPSVLSRALEELRDYFRGQRRSFTVPLCPQGTPFQLRVWNFIRTIPWGETRSYKEVAEAIGCPRGARAVGLALKANPLPIFIPCHRILRGDGQIGGFSLGLERKRWLLEHEGMRVRWPGRISRRG